jgi:hypothetical protein
MAADRLHSDELGKYPNLIGPTLPVIRLTGRSELLNNQANCSTGHEVFGTFGQTGVYMLDLATDLCLIL